jgi:phospholipase C
VPGETWPNRNFLHAATSDGETNIDPRLYENPTIFEVLTKVGKSWHIYHDDTPQVWAFVNLWDTEDAKANWFEFTEFAQHVAQDKLATYSFIEPNHRPPLHTMDHAPVVGSPDVSNNQHPGNNHVSNAAYDTWTATTPTDFSRAEQLIATVYEALRSNPAVFEKSVLLITYDEHGGLYDHVPPPTDAAPPGEVKSRVTGILHALYRRKSESFDFKTLGPRVPAVVVSPFIKPGTVSAEVRDHSSVPATLRALYAPDQPPLTPRDATAKPFTTLLNLTDPRRVDLPNLSAYVLAPVASAPPLAATAPAAAAQQAATSVPAGVEMPDFYQDMVKLSDLVNDRLQHKGAAPAVTNALPPHVRAAAVSAAFMAQAAASRAARPGG